MEPEIFEKGGDTYIKTLRGYNYIWIQNNIEIDGESEDFAVNEDGKIYLQLVDKYGNKSLRSQPVERGEKQNNIDFVEDLINPEDIEEIDIYNLSGIWIARINSPVEMINIPFFAKGVYIFILKTKKGLLKQKKIIR